MNWTRCIKNTGFEASLEARKLYPVEEDAKATPTRPSPLATIRKSFWPGAA